MTRKVLLVGGNSGIGAETARLLAQQGWAITAAARRDGSLGELGIVPQPFDAEAVPTLDLPESLDGLVYFPGTINLKPVTRLTADDFRRDFEVNCLAAAQVIQQALPALTRSDFVWGFGHFHSERIAKRSKSNRYEDGT